LQRETCKIDLQREAYKQIKYRCMHGASMSSLGTTELWLFCRSRMPLFSPKGIRIGLFCGSRIRLFCLLFQKICESLGATVGTTAPWLFCKSRIRLFFSKGIRISGRHGGLSYMSLFIFIASGIIAGFICLFCLFFSRGYAHRWAPRCGSFVGLL